MIQLREVRVLSFPQNNVAKRIEEHVSRSLWLRKVEKDAKINWYMVSFIWLCPSEDQQVLFAATYLTEQGNDEVSNSSLFESAAEK